MTAANEATLTKLSDFVLDHEVVEGAIPDAVQELRPSRDTVEAKRAALEAELRKLEGEQASLVAAIARTGQVDALANAIKEREEDRARLHHELAALDGLERLSTFDVRGVERDLRKRLEEWRGLLRRQTPLSRQVITRLLDGRIAWTPRKEEGIYEFRRGRQVRQATERDRVLRKVWRPQQDSNPFLALKVRTGWIC